MQVFFPLLFVSAAATGFAPQGSSQENHTTTGSPVPADVSVEGLERVLRRGLGGAGGSTALTFGPVRPLVCALAIQDRATGECLGASSTPVPGLLFPPPHDGGKNNVVDGLYAFVGGGEGNRAASAGATVAGGTGNYASGYNTQFSYGGYATVSGGKGNTATGNRAVIAGGEDNTASGRRATIGGGYKNVASGYFGSTVGGGTLNSATGRYATVGGGVANNAIGEASVIAGGEFNRAAGDFSTIGGGSGNKAVGLYATVAGGISSVADADFSFAAGTRAKAFHRGAFVWGDSQSVIVDKASSAVDEFTVFCSGGARFFSNRFGDAGVVLAPGAGSWSSVSDRDSKEQVEPVDGREVLERLVSVPVATWSYKAQDDSIRHMGPMAQDFREAFGLGASDELIDTIDADGVALAAIQGLDELLKENGAQLAEKDAEIDELRARVERLEALAAALLAK